LFSNLSTRGEIVIIDTLTAETCLKVVI